MDFFEWDKKGDGITTPKHAEMKKERVNEPFDGLFQSQEFCHINIVVLCVMCTYMCSHRIRARLHPRTHQV